ncbi:hypothetical protein EUTSA_v10002259mg, partial [Eutrema salsugineum]
MVYTRSMMKQKKSAEAKTNNQTWLNLPFDLTLLIMQRMSLKDNIRASVVCKTWHKASVSVRVEDPTPWAMFIPIYKDQYQLYDPSRGKTHIVKFPKIGGLEICYSRDGWLLMHEERSFKDYLFFNPFTHERIEVAWPRMWFISDAIAFSCAPTSSSCVLVSVSDISKTFICIKTYRPTTKKWTTLTLPNQLPLTHKGFRHIVFSNGVFYCLTKIGCLGMFDLYTNSWNVLLEPPPKFFEISDDQCFMTEYQGDVYLVYSHGPNRKPTFLKLDLTNRKWTVKRRLPGLTFYLGFQSAVTTNRDFVDTQRLN